jgi:hypothetical protein
MPVSFVPPEDGRPIGIIIGPLMEDLTTVRLASLAGWHLSGTNEGGLANLKSCRAPDPLWADYSRGEIC